MSFDGTDEVDAIVARLKANLVGGRVAVSIEDAEALARNDDGSVKPYIVAITNLPTASTRDRTIAAGEQGQPQMLSGTIASYAADRATARRTAAGVLRTIVGWEPSDTASAIKSPGGYNGTRMDANSKPTRYECGIYFTCWINLGL